MPFPLSLVPALVQGATGIAQAIGGKNKLKNLERPQYETPSEVKQNAALARAQYADQRFAGQSAAENQVAANTANALAASATRGQGMERVGALVAQANRAQMQITAEQERQQRADLANLQDMQGVLAKYKDQEWQMNEFAPYAQRYNEGREQIGAGFENIYAGVDNAATVMQRLVAASQGSQPTTVNVEQVGAQASQQAQQSEYLDSQLARMLTSIAKKGNYYKNQAYKVF